MSIEVTHQQSHETRPNRFPKIFSSIQKMRPNPTRILSFGCSTGEECFTLAEMFPDAEIVGVDIDPWVIETAKKNNKYKDRVSFVTSLENAGEFDVVFCLMVFFSIYDKYEFQTFDEAVKTLNEFIAHNGLLVIYTAKYDFMRTTPAENFVPIRQWKHQHNKDKKYYFDGYYKKK